FFLLHFFCVFFSAGFEVVLFCFVLFCFVIAFEQSKISKLLNSIVVLLEPSDLLDAVLLLNQNSRTHPTRTIQGRSPRQMGAWPPNALPCGKSCRAGCKWPPKS